MPLASKIVDIVADFDAFQTFRMPSEMVSFLDSFFLYSNSRAVRVD